MQGDSKFDAINMNKVLNNQIPIKSTLNIKEVSVNYIKPNIESWTTTKEVLNQIYIEGANILYSKYIQSKIPCFCGDFYADAYEALASQETSPYDPGETLESLAFNWGSDSEPVTKLSICLI